MVLGASNACYSIEVAKKFKAGLVPESPLASLGGVARATLRKTMMFG